MNLGGDFDQMFECTKLAAAKKFSIFTSFIGIGVDFHSEMVSKLTKIRGANYFSADGEQSFEKLMLTDFNYMVTPICFNVEVFIESEAYEIQRTYGSPFDVNEFSEDKILKSNKLGFLSSIDNFFNPKKNETSVIQSGSVMKIDTLSASDLDEKKGVQGGIVLLQLRKKLSSKTPKSQSITVTIQYENANGKIFKHSDTMEPKKSVVTPDQTPISEMEAKDDEELLCEDNAVRKAILLVRYVRLAKQILKDYPDTQEIPAEKKQEVKEFQKWYKTEMNLLDDKDLLDHYDNLDRLKLT